MTLNLVSIQGVDSTQQSPPVPIIVTSTGNLPAGGQFVSIVPVPPFPETPPHGSPDVVNDFGFFGNNVFQVPGRNYAGMSFIALLQVP